MTCIARARNRTGTETVLRTGKRLTLHPSQGHAEGNFVHNGEHVENEQLTSNPFTAVNKLFTAVNAKVGVILSQIAGSDLGIADRIARSRGRLRRSRTIGGRFTVDEEQDIQNAARADGKLVSEWTRDALLHQARRAQSETAILTELVALRMLLNNVLRPMSHGQQVTPERFAAILTEVRTGKHQAAREVLAQYAATPKKEQ